MFNIALESKPFINEWDDLVLSASITISDFKEDFFLPISFWSVKDYISQWSLSLEEGMKRRNHSVLITSMYPPNDLEFIQSWIVYYSENIALVQNKIFFVDDYIDFDYKKINDFVESRREYSEFGEKISEWKCSLSSIDQFYIKLIKKLNIL